MSLPQTAPLIASGVTRRYGVRAVVEDVSLTLPPGEITALLGASGAGKSTLLRLFAGFEPVEAGEIRLGETVLSAPGRTVASEKRRIGLVFQDFALFPHLTAARNVAFGLKHLGKAEAKSRALDWLARFGLSVRASAYPHELSGGEQQRVAIARALAPQPAAILMDEPFSGLDPSLRDSVREAALSAVREAGIPALLVTHDPAEALEHAGRIAILAHGRLLQAAPSAEVYSQPASAAVAAALGQVSTFAAEAAPAGLVDPPAPAGSLVCVRPEGVILDPAAPVRAAVKARAHQKLHLQAGAISLTAYAPAGMAAEPGNEIGIRLDPRFTFIFPSGDA